MKINDDIILSHGLKLDEYSKIKSLLNRDPNYLELGIFLQCNEHCSYKLQRYILKSCQ